MSVQHAGADPLERAADAAVGRDGRPLLLLVPYAGPLPANLADRAKLSSTGPARGRGRRRHRTALSAGGAELTELRAPAAETGGILEVHRAAAAWARAEAACRRSQRGACSHRARAAGRRGRPVRRTWLALRALDERGRRYRGQLDDALLPAVCPYLGLASFDPAHFFGREQPVAELVARLVGSPLLAVVGPSGAGKSSATRRPAPGARERRAPWLPALGPGADAPRPAPARGAGPGVARRASRGGACGGPVRGAVHGLPRRAGARGVPRHWFHLRTATVACRSDRRARGLLRANRCSRAAHGASSARTRCWSGRCDATSFAAPSWSPHAGSGCEWSLPHGRADRGRGR